MNACKIAQEIGDCNQAGREIRMGQPRSVHLQAWQGWRPSEMHGEKSIHEKAPEYATVDLILPVGLRRTRRGFWLVVAKGDQNTASKGDQIPTPGSVAVELQKYGLVLQKRH